MALAVDQLFQIGGNLPLCRLSLRTVFRADGDVGLQLGLGARGAHNHGAVISQVEFDYIRGRKSIQAVQIILVRLHGLARPNAAISPRKACMMACMRSKPAAPSKV